MNGHDEEIDTKKAKHPHDGNTHKHPCFGMISICRTQGSRSNLFGSEIEVSNTIKIEISECEVTQDLGRNWYFSKGTIAEVELTPNQYAELISNPNTQGSPCTIRYRQDKGRIIPRHIDTVTKHVESKIESKLNNFTKGSREQLKEIQQLLGKKGSLKVSERNDISNLINNLVSSLNSSIPFYKDSVLESIDKAKIEAKAEIDSFAAHMINQTGLKVLGDEKLVRLLLESKDE